MRFNICPRLHANLFKIPSDTLLLLIFGGGWLIQVLDYQDFTEAYPGDAILANTSATEANIVDILDSKINATAVRKLEKLLEVQHVFQYMVSQDDFALTTH